jgi:hypothetical protein
LLLFHSGCFLSSYCMSPSIPLRPITSVHEVRSLYCLSFSLPAALPFVF